MRTKKSFKNIIWGVTGQLGVVGISIVNRSMIAHLLSSEYLGLTGLFGNIFSILNLAELGIGSAMIYALYRPVADENIEEQQQLMNFYRKMYRMVALAITVLGLMLIPFLDLLVNTDVPIDNLLLIYMMYLVQAASSYLYAYKTSIIIAHQNQYICTIYSKAGNIVQYVAQFIVLYVTHDYLYYLIAYIFCTMLPNILASHKAERMYPYINENRHEYPDEKTQKSIFANVKALFAHKIGSSMVYGTDNILMSYMVGLRSLGIYSNYSLITTNLSSLGVQIFESFSASIGNLVAEENDPKRVFKIYKALHFSAFLVYSYFTVAMAILFKPFILWIFGANYIFPVSTTALILAQFYLTNMRKITLRFKESMGLFRQDQYKALAETVVNLAASVLLASKFGINGILGGTVVDLLLLPFWIEPYVLFKHGFKEDFMKHMIWYFTTYLLWTLTMLFCGYVTWLVCSYVQMGGAIGIIAKGLVCTFVYGILMLMCFGWTATMRMLFSYRDILGLNKRKDI